MALEDLPKNAHASEDATLAWILERRALCRDLRTLHETLLGAEIGRQVPEEAALRQTAHFAFQFKQQLAGLPEEHALLAVRRIHVVSLYAKATSVVHTRIAIEAGFALSADTAANLLLARSEDPLEWIAPLERMNDRELGTVPIGETLFHVLLLTNLAASMLPSPKTADIPFQQSAAERATPALH